MGAGAWGTALAIHFAHHGHQVALWTHNADHAAVLAAERSNRRYLPDFDFLNAIGIDLKNNCQNPHYDTDTMETNINGIYLAGVVCGGRDTHLWFIENSRIHAKQIISNIIQKKESEKIPE